MYFITIVKPKIKVLAYLVPSEESLIVLQIATFLICLHMSFPKCVYLEREREVNVSLPSPAYESLIPS